MTGALCAAVTASICGMNPVLWSFLMAVMAGLGSFWMENWPPCTLVAALKGDQTHLVRVILYSPCTVSAHLNNVLLWMNIEEGEEF